MPKRIGTLGEKSLHAALKTYYAQPDDLIEHTVSGYVIDILRAGARAPSLCIEIQTRSFAHMKRKLLALLGDYCVHVVYPIAQERYIVRVERDGAQRSRRKSPKRGSLYEIFGELVSFPALINHPHLSLEILLVREEQLWIDDGAGSWRRRHWSILDRRLLSIERSIPLTTAADFANLLPEALPDEFDSGELATHLGHPRPLAQKMAYCLRTMGVLEIAGKRANALVYRRHRSRSLPDPDPAV